ncbi:unknown [Ruminococcus sp. CAG:624]|nr:unknown [Ruminococcus sp. CAG:624]
MMKNSDFLKMMEENDAAGISFFAFVIAPAFINIIAEAFFNTFLNAVIMTALVKGRVIKNNTAAIN